MSASEALSKMRNNTNSGEKGRDKPQNQRVNNVKGAYKEVHIREQTLAVSDITTVLKSLGDVAFVADCVVIHMPSARKRLSEEHKAKLRSVLQALLLDKIEKGT
jgi:hypothetical protein